MNMSAVKIAEVATASEADVVVVLGSAVVAAVQEFVVNVVAPYSAISPE